MRFMLFTLFLRGWIDEKSRHALVYLPRLEAAIPFGALLFLFLTDVDRGRDAWCLRVGDRAECDEWLRRRHSFALGRDAG